MSRGDGRRMMAINPAACRGLRGFGGAAPAAAPAWTPASITGVAEWWRADLGVTDAGAGAVSAWQGQIAGETLSQGTASARPTLTTVDGQAAILGDAGDWLQGAFSTITITQPHSWVLVYRPVTIGSGGAVDYYLEGDDVSNRSAVYIQAATPEWRMYAGAELIITSATPVAGTSGAVIATFNSTGSQIYHNDLTTPTKTGNAGTQAPNGMTVFATSAGAFKPNAYIHEIILVDQAITAGDLALLGAYLDARYAGLSLTY